MSWPPSDSTSGSTMGTSPADWLMAAYMARPRAAAAMAASLGRAGAEELAGRMVMTARHLVKDAPASLYLVQRALRLSRPWVKDSSGLAGRGTTPVAAGGAGGKLAEAGEGSAQSNHHRPIALPDLKTTACFIHNCRQAEAKNSPGGLLLLCSCQSCFWGYSVKHILAGSCGCHYHIEALLRLHGDTSLLLRTLLPVMLFNNPSIGSGMPCCVGRTSQAWRAPVAVDCELTYLLVHCTFACAYFCHTWCRKLLSTVGCNVGSFYKREGTHASNMNDYYVC